MDEDSEHDVCTDFTPETDLSNNYQLKSNVTVLGKRTSSERYLDSIDISSNKRARVSNVLKVLDLFTNSTDIASTEPTILQHKIKNAPTPMLVRNNAVIKLDIRNKCLFL